MVLLVTFSLLLAPVAGPLASRGERVSESVAHRAALRRIAHGVAGSLAVIFVTYQYGARRTRPTRFLLGMRAAPPSPPPPASDVMPPSGREPPHTRDDHAG